VTVTPLPSRVVVEAADEARRRLERDLHDGAQQRFVTASMVLGMAMRAAEREGVEHLTRQLAQVRAELDAGLAELRDLARGIHPPVLGDHGLRHAIDALLARSAVPASVDGDLPARPSAAVETALYFSVAEALTNVAKYAHAGHVHVTIGGDGAHAAVEVRDDGRGGADPAGGSGLRGLAERLAALGGRLRVDSDASGTTVRAEVPLDPAGHEEAAGLRLVAGRAADRRGPGAPGGVPRVHRARGDRRAARIPTGL
jgi:signal transduction histidine kinase